VELVAKLRQLNLLGDELLYTTNGGWDQHTGLWQGCSAVAELLWGNIARFGSCNDWTQEGHLLSCLMLAAPPRRQGVCDTSESGGGGARRGSCRRRAHPTGKLGWMLV